MRPDWFNNAENMFFSFLVLYFVIFLLLVKSLLLVERGTEVEGPVMGASVRSCSGGLVNEIRNIYFLPLR